MTATMEVVEIGVDGMYRSEAWSSFWHRDDAHKLVLAAITAIESSGRWKLVPVEPTEEIDAAEVVRVGVATAGENLVPNPRFSSSPKVTR